MLNWDHVPGIIGGIIVKNYNLGTDQLFSHFRGFLAKNVLPTKSGSLSTTAWGGGGGVLDVVERTTQKYHFF